MTLQPRTRSSTRSPSMRGSVPTSPATHKALTSPSAASGPSSPSPSTRGSQPIRSTTSTPRRGRRTCPSTSSPSWSKPKCSTRRPMSSLRTAPPRPEHADRYVRITVFLATVLFLVGISGHFKLQAARYGLITTAIVILFVWSRCSSPRPGHLDPVLPRIHRVIGPPQQGVLVVVGLCHRDADADAERQRHPLRGAERLDRARIRSATSTASPGPSCSPQSTTNSSPRRER